VAPYLALCREDAQQRKHSLREVFNGLRYVVRTGVQWRMVPHDLPPWPIIYQQAQRWIRAQCFQVMIEDLRMLLRGVRRAHGATHGYGSGQSYAAIDAGVGGASRL